MHTLQESGNEGHIVREFLDSFAALSLLQNCPSAPLCADPVVGPVAPLLCPPVTD